MLFYFRFATKKNLKKFSIFFDESRTNIFSGCLKIDGYLKPPANRQVWIQFKA